MIKRIITILLTLALMLSSMPTVLADEGTDGNAATEIVDMPDVSPDIPTDTVEMPETPVEPEAPIELEIQSEPEAPIEPEISAEPETPSNPVIDAFDELWEEGLIEEDTIDPDAEMELEELQDFMERLLKYTAEELNARFPRIPAEDWEKIQERVAAAGIDTSGIDIYDDSTWENRIMTRERAFVIIAKIFDLKYGENPLKQFQDYNIDKSDVAEWVNAMVNSGYVQGDGVSLLLQENITWGQFAAIIKRILENGINVPDLVFIRTIFPITEDLIDPEYLGFYNFTTDDMGKNIVVLYKTDDMEYDSLPFPQRLKAETVDGEEVYLETSEWYESGEDEMGYPIYIPAYLQPHIFVLEDTANLPYITVEKMAAPAMLGMPDAKQIAGGAKKLLMTQAIKVLNTYYEQHGGEGAGKALSLLRMATGSTAMANITAMVKELQADMTRLESEVLSGFRELKHALSYNEFTTLTNEMEIVQNDIKYAWKLYAETIEKVTDSDGVLIDEEYADMEHDIYKPLRNELAKISYRDHFNKMDTILVSSRGEGNLYYFVNKLCNMEYPFEHQTTQQLVDTYRWATGLQIQLLMLYKEHTAFTGEDDFDRWESQVSESINAQHEWLDMDNRSHLEILDDEGNQITDDNERLLYPDTVNDSVVMSSGDRYNSYNLVSNNDGRKIIILKDLFEMQSFFGYDMKSKLYDGLSTTSDRRFRLAKDMSEFDGLLGGAEGGIPYNTWLIQNGGLTFAQQPQVIMLDKCVFNSFFSSYTQYLARMDSSKLPTAYTATSDYERWDSKDCYNKKDSVYIAGVNANKGTAKAIMIYVDLADYQDAITPKTMSEFSTINVLTDGQVLDLREYSGDITAIDQNIEVSGRVKVISDPNKKLENVSFTLAPGVVAPELILEDVNMTGRGRIDTEKGGGSATLEIVGRCSIDNTNDYGSDYSYFGYGDSLTPYCTAIFVNMNSELLLIGEGELSLNGIMTVLVTMDAKITISQLTLNVTSHGGAAIGGRNDIGSIVIDGGANVTATSTEKHIYGRYPDTIGSVYDRMVIRSDVLKETPVVQAGKIENCTLNLDRGTINKSIVIGDNVIWAGKAHYVGSLKTKNKAFAGTNSDIRLNIYGSEATVSDIKLRDLIHDYGDLNAFSQGDKEGFDLSVQYFGEIEYIELYSNGSDDWQPESLSLTLNITAEEERNMEKYSFELSGTINKKSGNVKFYPS